MIFQSCSGAKLSKVAFCAILQGIVVSGSYLVQGNRNLKPPIQLPDWYQIMELREQQE